MTWPDLFDAIVLIAYVWLLIELLYYAVPSEASVYQLIASDAYASSTGKPGASAPGGADRAAGMAGSQPPDSLTRARSRSRPAKVLLYLLPTAIGIAMFAIPLVAVFWPCVLEWLGPLPSLDATAIAGFGAALILGGRALTFASVLQIRAQHQRRDLQPSGLFARSRNPGLLGMYAFYLGNCLVFPCLGLFLGFVPYVWNMHRRVLMEESHLLRTVGPAYLEYANRVPRYLLRRGLARTGGHA